MTVEICFHSTLMERKALEMMTIKDKFQDFAGERGSRYYYWVYVVEENELKKLKDNNILFIEWIY